MRSAGPSRPILAGILLVTVLALAHRAEIRQRAEAALGRGMPTREAALARGFVLGEDKEHRRRHGRRLPPLGSFAPARGQRPERDPARPAGAAAAGRARYAAAHAAGLDPCRDCRLRAVGRRRPLDRPCRDDGWPRRPRHPGRAANLAPLRTCRRRRGHTGGRSAHRSRYRLAAQLRSGARHPRPRPPVAGDDRATNRFSWLARHAGGGGGDDESPPRSRRRR